MNNSFNTFFKLITLLFMCLFESLKYFKISNLTIKCSRHIQINNNSSNQTIQVYDFATDVPFRVFKNI
jgi:hypothetical protein